MEKNVVPNISCVKKCIYCFLTFFRFHPNILEVTTCNRGNKSRPSRKGILSSKIIQTSF